MKEIVGIASTSGYYRTSSWRRSTQFQFVWIFCEKPATVLSHRFGMKSVLMILSHKSTVLSFWRWRRARKWFASSSAWRDLLTSVQTTSYLTCFCANLWIPACFQRHKSWLKLSELDVVRVNDVIRADELVRYGDWQTTAFDVFSQVHGDLLRGKVPNTILSSFIHWRYSFNL